MAKNYTMEELIKNSIQFGMEEGLFSINLMKILRRRLLGVPAPVLKVSRFYSIKKPIISFIYNDVTYITEYNLEIVKTLENHGFIKRETNIPDYKKYEQELLRKKAEEYYKEFVKEYNDFHNSYYINNIK